MLESCQKTTQRPTVHDAMGHTVHDVLRQNRPRCPETSQHRVLHHYAGLNWAGEWWQAVNRHVM